MIPPSPGTKPIRSLVVEDDPVSRLLVQEVLRKRGHEVVPAGDAESALAAFSLEPFELVLLDLQLPGMDGIPCLKQLRALPSGPDALILIVTGSDRSETLEEALAAGADDYVVKPVVDHQFDVRLAIAERRVRATREQRAAQEALVRDALYDGLTGLPNRVLLMERLERALQRHVRGGHATAVLVVDLDGFREVGRAYGDAHADAVLVEVGRRLEPCLSEGDTVARLEEDEFALLLDEFRDVSDPLRVVQRAQHALRQPFPGGPEGLTASVGLALSIGAERSGEDMLRDAYRALVRAKARGPGGYQIHDPAQQARAVARVEFETEIRRAWEAGDMRLHYMPIVELETGRLAAFEALVRWFHPSRGLVLPSEFIPIAEETGLVVDMGWWILDEALRQMRAWEREGAPAVPVGVNLSGRQFEDRDLCERVLDALGRSGVDPRRLHLEITESAVMAEADEAVRTLGRLAGEGIGLHVDDFGTGYSSLSYLCRLPVDTLKVDRSFIGRIPGQVDDLEIVRTIVQLARNLRLDVIAEGIETDEQHDALRGLACRLGQGYRFGGAVSPEEAAALARTRGAL